jgi:hypothetical protein
MRVCNEDIRCRIKGGMVIRRIFASSIVALLLLVTPLAVACDLACAFSSLVSDCHTAQAAVQTPASGEMNMDGMNMSGMDMSKTPGEMDRPADAAASRTHEVHPSIGDMGPCEKQACAGSPATSTNVKKSDLGNLHVPVALVAAERHPADAASALFRIPRDEITQQSGAGGSHLHLNLRI